MSTHDHRSPGSPHHARAGGAVAMASYVLPGLAAALARRCAGRSGSRTAPRAGAGYALTFDDGPARAGHARGARDPRARERASATFFLVGEQVRRNPALARRDRRGRPRDRPALRPPPQSAAPGAAAGARGHRARAGRRSSGPAAARSALYRPPYGVLNASALRLARARGWRTLLWSHWGKDWQARATPESIAARVTERRRRGLGAAPARRRRLLGRRTPGGAPRRRCRGSSRRSPGAVSRPVAP